jgi:hypothetical protein
MLLGLKSLVLGSFAVVATFYLPLFCFLFCETISHMTLLVHTCYFVCRRPNTNTNTNIQYIKASTLAYQLKNYPDFFASLTPPKYMVMKKDGTFVIFTEEELTPLKQAGKIKIENPMAFGGTIMDVTQKPVMVLVE